MIQYIFACIEVLPIGWTGKRGFIDINMVRLAGSCLPPQVPRLYYRAWLSLMSRKTSRNRQIISNKIAEGVAFRTGIKPKHVGFVPRNTIPKTTSGKLQRSHLRKMYLELLQVS